MDSPIGFRTIEVVSEVMGGGELTSRYRPVCEKSGASAEEYSARNKRQITSAAENICCNVSND